MDETSIKYIIEAALLASAEPLSTEEIMSLFDENSRPQRKDIRAALDELEADYEDRGIMLAEVASGYRVQVRPSMTAMLQPLWEERPPRYSRALFETMALIAYRQPITRGEIEDVRGVTVSPNIIRTLLDREWIRVLGHRDVPGKPEMFGTTKGFLDYFGLKRLEDLPPLAELQDIEGLNAQLEFATGEESEAVPANVTALRAAEGGDEAEAADDEVGLADGESVYEDEDEPAPADEVAEAEASQESEESEEAGEEERARAGAPPSS